MNAIKLGTSAKEIRELIASGEATTENAVTYIEEREAARKAKGKFLSYMMRSLYEELTGNHIKGKMESKGATKPKAEAKPAKAAKVAKVAKPTAKFDEEEYAAKAVKMKGNTLKFALSKAKDPAKLAILNAEAARREQQVAEDYPAPSKASAPLDIEALLAAQGVNVNDLSPEATALLAMIQASA